MIADQIKELVAAKSRVAELESAIASGLRKELAALPARYGFADVNAFITALRKAGSKRRGRKPGVAKAVKPTGRKRRKRAVITDATRAEVKKLVEGGKTGNEIAASLRISVPSVHNIKSALGLIRKKKK